MNVRGIRKRNHSLYLNRKAAKAKSKTDMGLFIERTKAMFSEFRTTREHDSSCAWDVFALEEPKKNENSN